MQERLNMKPQEFKQALEQLPIDGMVYFKGVIDDSSVSVTRYDKKNRYRLKSGPLHVDFDRFTEGLVDAYVFLIDCNRSPVADLDIIELEKEAEE